MRGMAPIIGEFLAAPLSPPCTGSSTGQAFVSRQIQLETPPARSTRVRREQIYAPAATEDLSTLDNLVSWSFNLELSRALCEQIDIAPRLFYLS